MKVLILLLLISCSTKEIIGQAVTEINTEQAKSFYKSESKLKWINEVISAVDCVTIKKEYHAAILKVESFSHYGGTNQKIVSDLISPVVARVGDYYKKYSVWPKKTATRAYRNPGENKIWINRATVDNKPDINLIETFIHERFHVLGYGHKGNKKYQYDNINSVPYKASELAGDFVEGCL